jgi:hypothetical protein
MEATTEDNAMALLPDNLKLTEEEAAELERIRTAAKIRHEKARKAARQRGRLDFPDLPYECSWAYEEEFRNRKRGT